MKRFITIILSLVLVLAITLPSAAITNTNPAAFSKYSPPITISPVHYNFSTQKWSNGDDTYNNPFTREIEKSLGIKVKYDWVVDQTQYDNKLNLSIASGDIPDFFLTNNPQGFVNLANSGKLADLTSAYEKYASDKMKDAANSFPDGFNSGKIKGKLYGLPVLQFGQMTNLNVMWIRNDWLEKFKLSAPKSMSDVENLSKAFMKNVKGSYGIAVTNILFNFVGDLSLIANGYHAYPGMWIKDAKGQIVYGSTQPQMKTFLQAMQNWYKSGVISKVFGAADVNKVNADIVSGKVGITCGANWLGYWPFPDAKNADPTSDWRAFSIPSVDSNKVKVTAGWPVYQYWVVNKNCKNPEAVIKICNLFMNKTDYADLKTIDANLNWQDSPAFYTDPSETYNQYINISKALSTKDPSKLDATEKGQYNEALAWVDKKDVAGLGRFSQVAANGGAFSVNKKVIDDNAILMTELRGSMPTGYAKTKATLDKLELDAFTKIIMGAPISNFDKFVKNWTVLGGRNATNEINSIFNSK